MGIEETDDEDVPYEPDVYRRRLNWMYRKHVRAMAREERERDARIAKSKAKFNRALVREEEARKARRNEVVGGKRGVSSENSQSKKVGSKKVRKD